MRGSSSDENGQQESIVRGRRQQVHGGTVEQKSRPETSRTTGRGRIQEQQRGRSKAGEQRLTDCPGARVERPGDRLVARRGRTARWPDALAA